LAHVFFKLLFIPGIQRRAIYSSFYTFGQPGGKHHAGGLPALFTIGLRQHFENLYQLAINPANDILFFGDFTDTFNLTVNDNRRCSKNAIAGYFHRIGNLLNAGSDARLCDGFLDDFFGLPTFRAAGSQDFDIQNFSLLFLSCLK
jgi:hypothetical protein